MVVGRNIRLAVLVMADASVPSRRRRGFEAGSQGTVTWRFVRVIVFGRIGCHALVAAMAYSAGQQRRIAAMCCRLHSAQVCYHSVFVRRDTFSTGSAARVRLETGLVVQDVSGEQQQLLRHSITCLDRAGAAESRHRKGRNLQLRPVTKQAGEL